MAKFGLILITFITFVFLPESLQSSTEINGATETQTAQCTITTGDVKASAQAQVTTRLEGVCETNDMMTAFQLLETKLMQELFNIRIVLSQIQNPHFNFVQHTQFMFPPMNLHPTLYNKISKPATKQNVTPITNTNSIEHPKENENLIPKNDSTQDETHFKDFNKQPIMTTTEVPAIVTSSGQEFRFGSKIHPLLKSLPSKKTGPRDFEVYKFNNTILSGNEVQIFNYFWKIDNYTNKLFSNKTETFSSSPFVISGFNLRVKASPNHLKRDYLYITLDEVPADQMAKSNSSIILETGNLFKEIDIVKKFHHKIAILDQSPDKNDLISQEFIDTSSGFMIPNSAILSSSYIKDNCVLIKIIIYL